MWSGAIALGQPRKVMLREVANLVRHALRPDSSELTHRQDVVFLSQQTHVILEPTILTLIIFWFFLFQNLRILLLRG